MCVHGGGGAGDHNDDDDMDFDPTDLYKQTVLKIVLTTPGLSPRACTLFLVNPEILFFLVQWAEIKESTPVLSLVMFFFSFHIPWDPVISPPIILSSQNKDISWKTIWSRTQAAEMVVHVDRH